MSDSPDGSAVHLRQLEVLNEIARIATADLELRPMLQRVTDALARKFGWEFVACVVIDRDGRHFVCEALTSSVPSHVTVGYRRELGTGVVGEVAQSGRTILLDDVSKSTNYVETMHGARSELCVPVRHRGRTVAILNLESRQPAAFHDEQSLLETVADQISGAIASARLFDEVTRRAALMQMMSEVSRTALEADDLPSLLDRIVCYIAERFDVANVALLIGGPDEYELAAIAGENVASVRLGERWSTRIGIGGRAIRTGEDQLVLDVASDPDYFVIDPQVVAEFILPIRFGDTILGALGIESRRRELFWSENIIAFRSFADQIAGAIRLASMNSILADANRLIEEKTHALERANEQLQLLSTTDALTGVANRRKFEETLDVEWRRGRRIDAPLSLAFVDVDHFKAYNDSRGHRKGDECLKSIAGALRDTLKRAEDLVARYGGEEFAILLPNIDADHATMIGEQLRAAIEALAEGPDCVTISVGVATKFPAGGNSPWELIEAADQALYVAKNAGRNRVVHA